MSEKPTSAKLYAMTGLGEDVYTTRKVTIHRPCKSTMQSGKAHMKQWKIL